MLKKIIVTVTVCFVMLLIDTLPAYAVPTSAMKLGSKGPDVRELQQKLADYGYLEEMYITGFFGPNTVDAVKKYQSASGIEATGEADGSTLDLLFVQTELDNTLVLRNGDEGEDVRRFQQLLSDRGYLEEKYITGIFGDNTETAVKKFQKDNGISATGIAASQTIEKLNSLTYIKPLDETRVYQSGDEDGDVKELQQRLCNLGYLSEKYVTGYYGAITVAAVKKFQKNNQISQTGTVGPLTVAALNSAAAKINTDQGSDIDCIAKPGTLRLGDSGPSVTTLQKNLKKLGYFSGTATGEFGDVTKEAVTKFQKAHSLTADGIATAKTLSKISAAISAKNASSAQSASSSASSSEVTVSGYNSANMDVVNSAIESLSSEQMEEVILMAKIIKREAGGNSYKCQLAVASVIMNRVDRTGASVHDVLYAPNQFSTANSSLPNETYSTTNYYAALEAYMGVKPVGKCLYFCLASLRYSSWMGKNRTYYCTIGSEAFFL